MFVNQTKYKVFCYATDHQPELMNQALCSAFLVEQEILDKPEIFTGIFSVQDFLDRYGISRSVGHEALRVLQHRKVIATKRGPNGGLQVIPQSDENLKAAIYRYLIHQKFGLKHCKQAREFLEFITSYLAPENPSKDLLKIMFELLGDIESNFNEETGLRYSGRSDLRADQIANTILLNANTASRTKDCSRIGHENDLSEHYQVSKPVMRQAIRILEAESLVQTRRGRGCGIYLSKPLSGPVSRLLALWLLGRHTSLSDIFEFEHPLRVYINMQASKNVLVNPAHKHLLELQNNMESHDKVRLIDIINMEKQISWLADNPLLDLLLKSMTVYKVSRAQYQEYVFEHSHSYVSLNSQLLHGLLKHKDSHVENYCQEKNIYLMNYDLESMHTH